MKFSFCSAANQPPVPTVVITGVARSGKTLVGNLLGSCLHAEHIDEPWILMELPIMAGKGLLPEPVAVNIFQTYLYELLNDRVLMRHANFRPADLSSVWRQKTPQEILDRLLGLQSRDDVRRYLRESHTTAVLTLTDTVPFCAFFQKALPGCRIVHVVHDGFEVAFDVAEKHWLSNEELVNPRHSNLYRHYVRPQDRMTYHLPFWLEEGKEEIYLGWSEYARALYYWRRHMEVACESKGVLEGQNVLRVIRLSDILDRPCDAIRALTEFLGLTPTELTEDLLRKIVRRERQLPDKVFAEVSHDEWQAVKKSYEGLGLSADRLEKHAGKLFC